MEEPKSKVFYVLGIIKPDNTFYRTIARLEGREKGRLTYLDLKNLEKISALGHGNRAITVHRCMGTVPKDKIVLCEPIYNLTDSSTSEPFDLETAEEATRISTVGLLLEGFDEKQKAKKGRK